MKDDDPKSMVEPPKVYQYVDSILKSDLLKFAEALKQPTPSKGKIPKKVASIM